MRTLRFMLICVCVCVCVCAESVTMGRGDHTGPVVLFLVLTILLTASNAQNREYCSRVCILMNCVNYQSEPVSCHHEQLVRKR